MRLTENDRPAALLALIALTALALAGCGGGDESPAAPQLPTFPSAIADAIAEIEAAPVPEGVDAAVFGELKAELARVVREAGAAKIAGAPPTDAASATVVDWEEPGTLRWRYYCTGDYDQNGEVNISDLTPLGLHFGETGPFAQDSALSVVDGDNNSEINIADVTPIGMAFGTAASGYNVYAGNSAAQIPSEPDGPNGAATRLLGLVLLADATGQASSDRLQFSYVVSDAWAGEVYWVRPTDGESDGTPSQVAVQVADTISSLGGSVQLDDVVVSADPRALVGDINLTHSVVPVPDGIPLGYALAGQAHEISVDNPVLLNAPLIIELPYDDTGVTDESLMAVLHYTEDSGFMPTTLHSIDPVENTITFDARWLATFIPVELTATANGTSTLRSTSQLPDSYEGGFDATLDGWNITNFGNYFSPGGNCFGMAGYAAWFYRDRPAEILNNKYSSAGGYPTSIAHLTAARAHLAQCHLQYLLNLSGEFWTQQSLLDQQVARQMKTHMYATDMPLVLLMGRVTPALTFAGHACVVHGWDAAGFKFYEVNVVDSEMTLPYTPETGFGVYNNYTMFGYLAIPSLGSRTDFALLTDEAEAGFTSSQDIEMTTPTPDAVVSERELEVAGALGGGLIDAVDVLIYANGNQWLAANSAGDFSTKAALRPGENTLVVFAGTKDYDELINSWHHNSAVLIREVECTDLHADMHVTLTWDTYNAVCDLIVYEPLDVPGYNWSQEVYTHGLASLKLTNFGLEASAYLPQMFGPVWVELCSAEGDTVVPGEYIIQVIYDEDNYYGQGEPDAGPVSGLVTISLFEGTAAHQVQQIPFALASPDPMGGTGYSLIDGPGRKTVARITPI